MKKCVKCGKITKSNNLTICSMCGGNLINAKDFPETDYPVEKIRYVAEKKKNNKNTVVTVLLVIILVAVIGVGGFLVGQMFGNEEDKNQQSSEVEETEKKLDIDVEEEVKKIREKKAHVENESLTEKIAYDGTKVFFNSSGDIVKTESTPDKDFGYSRLYYFDNGELYFAFVFKGNETEHRFYFNTEELFRWKEGIKGKQKDHDFEDSTEFDNWEQKIKEDSKKKYSLY